jgi:hypothetical protein
MGEIVNRVSNDPAESVSLDDEDGRIEEMACEEEVREMARTMSCFNLVCKACPSEEAYVRLFEPHLIRNHHECSHGL